MPNPSEPQAGAGAGQLAGLHPLPSFTLEVQSGPLAAREMLARVSAHLTPAMLDAEESFAVNLILTEVMNNIVEHAYPCTGQGGPIILRCRHKPDGLHFCIRDQGRVMPEGKLPNAALPEASAQIDDLPEGGFGWFLIDGLAKDIRYRRQGSENRLDLRIAVAYGQG